jgi:2-aminoethylphosphonate-pyruvate transaminase
MTQIGSAPKLLNPGPVTLTDRVREALHRPDICHREPEFAALSLDVIDRLGRVYGSAADSYRAVLLTGSGTAAVEAMVGSLVPRDGRALVAANGVYGERIVDILRAHGKSFDVAAAEWIAPIDLDAVDAQLATGAFTHVIAVHHETTTGRLNDIDALGERCRHHGVALLLDAVSSFGGEQIRFEEWNLEACAATANKCLHGIPGAAFVVARDTAFDRPTGSPSVYLDLHRYRKAQETGYSPFTQAPHVLYALDEALQELADAGGWEARRSHYRSLTDRVRQGLRDLGVAPLLEPAESSAMLTAYHLPAGASYDRLHDQLKDDGYVIYAGQGFLDGRIFRIAVMGDLMLSDVDRVVASATGVLAPASADRAS